jgi:hypothetical protein
MLRYKMSVYISLVHQSKNTLMTRKFASVFFGFFLSVSTLSAQQTAAYTNELVTFNRALELYNNEQYLAAQKLFDDVKNETRDEKIESDAAYYIANAAVRLGTAGGGQAYGKLCGAISYQHQTQFCLYRRCRLLL